VTGVEIEGAHAISAKELIARLATQPPEHRYLVVPRAQKLDQEAFENDKRRILRHYQARGYYRARIEAADILPDGAGRVRIRIRVDEGLPARVTRVEVLGLEGAPEARARLNLGIAPGNIFTEAAFDAGRVAILEALTRSGWAKATVEEHAQVDPALNEVRVAYTAKPGERYRFGSVFVSGAAAVPQTRIRSEAQRATNPGTIFDSSDLKEAQSRVFEMGVFGGVRVTEGPPDEKRHTIPVDVSVHEAPFRTIRAGPGFTLEGNVRWEADATLAWSHRNWLGGLRKLNLEGRVGYAWLPTVFNSTEQGFVGRLLADFTQPQILTRYLDLNLHGELERGIEQAYSFFAERFRMGVPFKLGRVVRFAPSLNFELYQIGGVPSATGEASSLLLATCPSQDPNLCLLAYFARLPEPIPAGGIHPLRDRLHVSEAPSRGARVPRPGGRIRPGCTGAGGAHQHAGQWRAHRGTLLQRRPQLHAWLLHLAALARVLRLPGGAREEWQLPGATAVRPGRRRGAHRRNRRVATPHCR